MTATNHVLTGAFIAAAVHSPIVALPAAFLSHFILDAIPHFEKRAAKLNSSFFKSRLLIDVAAAGLCLLVLFILQPAHVWIIVAGGVLAASPDLMWLSDYVAANQHKPRPRWGFIRRFHSRIQWYQSPPGIVVEIAWGFGMVALLQATLVR